MGMGSKAKKITVGYKYYMGLFMGLFRGPVNEITEIRVGDRTAWTGSLTQNSTISINQSELFGGTKAEGGIDGRFELYMGGQTQTISQALRSMLGGRQPQYRGVVTAFFDGMICAMNPYPKAWKFKTRRSTAGWYGGVWYEPKCLIKMLGYDGAGNQSEIHAMNPAHILYECQSNFEWGRGLNRDLVDDVSFRKAADQLYEEGFGLCIAWKRQDTLEAFQQIILDHIGGAMYVSKQTGKLTLKLIRKDYNFDSLPIFDSDSGLLSIDEATNASPANFVNEVIVTYHNPIMDEDQQVRCHNLAQIQNQQCLNSNTVEYMGIPTGKLAMQVAQRDLRVSSTNVRRFTVVCDRRAWNINPGDVFKIRDPKQRGLTEVVVRVGTVEDGTLTDGKIKIVALQDQFAFQLNTFNQVEPPTGYVPDLQPALARRIVYEMPWVDMVQQIPQGELNSVSDDQSFINSQAEKPTAMSAAYDMGIMAEGEATYDVRGNGDFGALGDLAADVSYLDNTFILSGMTAEWADVQVGMAARIAKPVLAGQTTQMEISEEFVRIDNIQGNIITVSRGVMDTIPWRHQKGEVLWVTTFDGGTDWQRYAGNEGIDIKILPWTLGGGRYPIDDAPVDHLDMDFRHARPYPPGAVQHYLASSPTLLHWYTPSSLSYTANSGETPDTYYLIWAHRDRLMQADKLVGHMEGDIGPESGTTYTVRIYDQQGALVRTETGITGTTWQWPYATAANDVNVEASTVDPVLATLRLTSVRNGRECWEYYETKVSVYKKPPQFVYDASLMHAAVQPFNADSTTEPPYEPQGGPAVASMMHQAVQPATFFEADSMNGPNIALLPHQVTQESVMVTPLDTLLYETPYIQLSRTGKNLNESKVSAYVARSSDRTVDSYTLFTKHESDANYTSSGSQPWTPWGVTALGMGFFSDEVTMRSTSDKDGVPIAMAQPGDLILIDQEIMLIKSVSGNTFKVGRCRYHSGTALQRKTGVADLQWLRLLRYAVWGRRESNGHHPPGQLRDHHSARPFLPAAVANAVPSETPISTGLNDDWRPAVLQPSLGTGSGLQPVQQPESERLAGHVCPPQPYLARQYRPRPLPCGHSAGAGRRVPRACWLCVFIVSPGRRVPTVKRVHHGRRRVYSTRSRHRIVGPSGRLCATGRRLGYAERYRQRCSRWYAQLAGLQHDVPSAILSVTTGPEAGRRNRALATTGRRKQRRRN
jgi:hypothetical protein